MGFADFFHGHGDSGTARRAATAALTAAVHAIVTLDNRLQSHPLQAAWLRLDREVALVAAVRDGGGPTADLEHVLSARMGAKSLPRGHIALGDLDARADRWNRVRQRKGPAELRALVTALAPVRGALDLVRLAEVVAAELARCVSPSWRFEDDGDAGPSITIEAGAGDGGGAGADTIDAADLALAVPYALRRLGVTRLVLPSLSGRVRVFAHEHEQPLDALTSWAGTLAEQAGEGAARLRLLERYAAGAEVKLGAVRRPEALRRLVGVGLSSWSLWAAQLARMTGVEMSSAWRSLEQAAEFGLVVAVPVERRSRGDGALYAIPPWLQLAGLIPVRPGRPRTVTVGLAGLSSGAEKVSAAMAEADAAMVAIDALLGRSTNRSLNSANEA